MKPHKGVRVDLPNELGYKPYYHTMELKRRADQVDREELDKSNPNFDYLLSAYNKSLAIFTDIVKGIHHVTQGGALSNRMGDQFETVLGRAHTLSTGIRVLADLIKEEVEEKERQMNNVRAFPSNR